MPYPLDKCIYFLSDVHYYLPGYKFKNTKECDYYTCVGGNFRGIPGHYTLPFNEGHYIVRGDATVMM